MGNIVFELYGKETVCIWSKMAEILHVTTFVHYASYLPNWRCEQLGLEMQPFMIFSYRWLVRKAGSEASLLLVIARFLTVLLHMNYI